MNNEFDVFKAGRFDFQSVVFHPRYRSALRADIAMKLMEHFAVVATTPDGEDSAGRRAFRLQTPDELVARACEIAGKLVDEFERRGWMIEIPPYQEIPDL